jgi:23S rRNA (adenine(2503)-C(2))-methyltransferase
MNLSLVKDFLDSNHQPPFRFRQIVKNYYSGRYSTFSQMTDLSLSLRSQLDEKFSLLSVFPDKILVDHNTQKAALVLKDGLKIETVLMDYGDWLTACVSSQVGCPLGCAFCATGKMGFKRNLTTEEIVDQILFWKNVLFPFRQGGKRPEAEGGLKRIVFMGMGEPFLNWENLLSALDIIKQDLKIGARKISISTAGIADKIIEFADLSTEINLAVSLHSAIQSTRQSLMPIAKKYPLDQLKLSLKYYTTRTRRQVFFEYALIKDINDTEIEINELIKFIQSNRLFYLNLISLNPIKDGLTPSINLKNVENQLNRRHIEYSVRQSFGQKIASACGQLIQ